jgi:hypothetical protein
MTEGHRGGGRRSAAPWELTTPVSNNDTGSSLSSRGFFWVGWAVGFVNALICFAAAILFRHLLS